jgi:hypothetical protein|tara:strand:- start:739 stop:1023 length:285 start_codon:yes stop_codon:yes gene_type:complete
MRSLAIRQTHPSVVSINAGSEAWDKDGNLVTLDESKILKEITKLQAEYDAQAYARSRKAEYPPWEEQLDHIYHNGVASWKANMVKPVKDKYPKP